MKKIVGLELISACNLKCGMCPCKNHFSGKKLPENIVRSIFDDIAKYNNQCKESERITTIRFDGNNEPLLINNIHEIIMQAKIKNPNCQTYVTTNGLLLDAKMADKLLSAKVDIIYISLTGTTPETYSKFQGYGLSEEKCKENFERASQNASRFISKSKTSLSNTTVIMSFITSKDSVADIADYSQKWSAEGASLDIRGCAPNYVITHEEPKKGIKNYTRCSVVGHMLIKANGDLLLSCCHKAVPILGNIFESSLLEIFLSENFKKFEHAFDVLDIKNIPSICANCSGMHIYEAKTNKYSDLYCHSNKDTTPFSNELFKNNTLSEFYKQLAGRKLVLFGAGCRMSLSLKLIGDKINIHSIVDNDPEKQGKMINDIIIKPVESLKNENRDDLVVLMSMNVVSAAEKQLQSLGISRYFASTMFSEFYRH
jgi:MoaA/NifB/PqqE/SkfB family radical SAM enzyme